MSSDYVDFDLPSGLLWAKKNLGAETEEDAGLYFQWGDTQGYTAEQVGVDKNFNNDGYKFSIDGSSSNLSKYNSTDGKTVLDLEDDAAYVMLGDKWRIPTQEDFHELINNTDLYLALDSGNEIKGTVTTDGASSSTSIYFEWEQHRAGNMKGMKLYRKNDNSVYIFIPLSGFADVDSIHDINEIGVLYSSNRSNRFDILPYGFMYDYNKGFFGDIGVTRPTGVPIRAVLKK